MPRAVDLMTDARFRVLSGDSANRMPVDESELAARASVPGPGMIVVGRSGSGRSGTLKFLGYSAAEAARNLGTRGHDCVFPILIRANQLAAQSGSIEDQILNAIRKSGPPVGSTLLPSTFLIDLVETPRLHLLILIDGVDEIQNSRDLAEVIDGIGRISRDTAIGSRARLVVTSKPSTVEHFRYSGFDVYEIQALDATAIEKAAQAWLGDRAPSFLSENAALVRSGVLSSPLPLSVGLALYERGRTTLPMRLVDLYGQFVEASAESWNDPVLVESYGSEIVTNATDIFGFLALELLRSATIQDRAWLSQSVGRFFMQHLKADTERAGALAARFVEFASLHGLFLRTAGERLYWTHQSFQDYFAALRLTRSEMELGNAVKAIRGRWFDVNRGNAPRFATAMLSDPDERNTIVDEILASGREERFDFVTRLVVEGTPLPEDTMTRLVDSLEVGVQEQQEEYGTILRPSARKSFSLDLLIALNHVPQAEKALTRIAGDPRCPSVIRENARTSIPVAG
jgi:hypothetical protein